MKAGRGERSTQTCLQKKGSMEEGLSVGAGIAHFSWQVGKDERSHRGSFPAHTAPGRCLVALMPSVSNQLHLEECWNSFGTRPGIHKNNTPFIWCEQRPLCPAPALSVCLPHGRVVISHTVVTQLVLLLWLDNTEQLQESSQEDEDKENKAVFKSVTSVIVLEGGWEGEGRQHSVRAATTQVYSYTAKEHF